LSLSKAPGSWVHQWIAQVSTARHSRLLTCVLWLRGENCLRYAHVFYLLRHISHFCEMLVSEALMLFAGLPTRLVELEHLLRAVHRHLLQGVHVTCTEPPVIQCVRSTLSRSLLLVSDFWARYMCVLQDHNGAPRVIMRHAVPNSPDRIKMIGAALKSCKFPIKRVRMLSLLTRHGFNEEESMFVDQQRCFESQLPPQHCFFLLQSQPSISGVFGDHHSDWQQTEFLSISMQANANTKFNWANQGETHNAVCNSLAWLRYASWILKCVVKLHLLPLHLHVLFFLAGTYPLGRNFLGTLTTYLKAAGSH
jgi:hypothetical protein